MAPPAAVLDLDGTLVDTNYHHALCWYRAFRRHSITIPVWRLHRHVGMGGDMFVAAVAGDEVEEEHGDALRDDWEELFDELIDEVAPLDGARGLIAALKERGHEVVLASSSVQKHFDRFVELLDVGDLVDGWTTKDDVEASKPEPDLVRAALDKVRADRAVMLGDTPWDVEAARRAGVETVCLITGGFSEQELRDAGAVAVFESLVDLRYGLARTPFGED
ncbi:MAG TPA: HAD family hydrolase [Gaiellaceae bacterium]|nr:HAD family hydrolase [Gaiellaceae bacterium]